VPLKQIAKLQIFAEHIEAFVSAQAFELRRMLTAVHAGRQGAALQAVPAKVPPAEAGFRGARFDDRGRRPTV
jgi:hypothetical protein